MFLLLLTSVYILPIDHEDPVLSNLSEEIYPNAEMSNSRVPTWRQERGGDPMARPGCDQLDWVLAVPRARLSNSNSPGLGLSHWSDHSRADIPGCNSPT